MTDERVEAAAKAGWDYENIDRSWKDTPEDIKSAHRARARDMLEAAEAAAWSSDMDAAPDGWFLAARFAPGATVPSWVAMVEYGSASPSFIQCASYSGLFVAPPPVRSEDDHIRGRGGWRMHHGTLSSGADGPTHWRHLPKPPVSAK